MKGADIMAMTEVEVEIDKELYEKFTALCTAEGREPVETIEEFLEYAVRTEGFSFGV